MLSTHFRLEILTFSSRTTCLSTMHYGYLRRPDCLWAFRIKRYNDFDLEGSLDLDYTEDPEYLARADALIEKGEWTWNLCWSNGSKGTCQCGMAHWGPTTTLEECLREALTDLTERKQDHRVLFFEASSRTLYPVPMAQLLAECARLYPPLITLS
jgi:hypothetical protein